jgi:large conductance mechanosensitive channel
MLEEFKKFISRGNVMDLAVGVIIGGAFQAIVTSLVNDLITPLISIATKNVNFADLSVKVGEAELTYGNFISAIINFFIVALVIFFMVKAMNKLEEKNKASLAKISDSKLGKKLRKGKKSEKEEEKEPETKLCPFCLSEIPYKATKCAHCASDLEEK